MLIEPGLFLPTCRFVRDPAFKSRKVDKDPSSRERSQQGDLAVSRYPAVGREMASQVVVACAVPLGVAEGEADCFISAIAS